MRENNPFRSRVKRSTKVSHWKLVLCPKKNGKNSLMKLIDLGNILTEASRAENIRRIAEVAKLMTEAGLTSIVYLPFRRR